MDWVHIGLLVLIGLSAGAFGATFGLGGGAFVVPLLTLGMGIPIQFAAATSLVAIAATSCGSAASYIKARFTNIRLGIWLETTTTIGALAGAFLATRLKASVLEGMFGLALIFSAYMMHRRGVGAEAIASETSPETSTQDSAASGRLGYLGGEYRDPAGGETVRYRPRRPGQGLAISTLAGALSGLLGIGGGVVKIPVMNLVMGLPMKAAIGTSNFMIGITAIASAFVYYSRGYMDALTAAPVLVGVFMGSQLGVRIVHRTKGQRLAAAFSLVLVVTAVLMLLRAVGVQK